jgi:hypothetical protein
MYPFSTFNRESRLGIHQYLSGMHLSKCECSTQVLPSPSNSFPFPLLSSLLSGTLTIAIQQMFVSALLPQFGLVLSANYGTTYILVNSHPGSSLSATPHPQFGNVYNCMCWTVRINACVCTTNASQCVFHCTCQCILIKGPYTRVRFCVRIAVPFRARFSYKGLRVSICIPTPITTACQCFSGKINLKMNSITTLCWKSYPESYGNSYAKSHV